MSELTTNECTWRTHEQAEKSRVAALEVTALRQQMEEEGQHRRRHQEQAEKALAARETTMEEEGYRKAGPDATATETTEQVRCKMLHGFKRENIKHAPWLRTPGRKVTQLVLLSIAYAVSSRSIPFDTRDPMLVVNRGTSKIPR